MKVSKATLSTIVLTAILLSSGFVLPASAAQGAGSYQFGSHDPTSVGPASKYLLAGGPVSVNPFSGPSTKASVLAPSSNSPSVIPLKNPKPGASLSAGLFASLASPTTVPPTVSCQPVGPGCDSISQAHGQVTSNPLALNALDSTPFTVEPPDQGLCAGNGYVMEILNQGELQVYNTGLTAVSGVVPLDTLMGLTAQGWSSGGDISCLYDYDNGGHWFITQMVSETTEASGGPFAGCFAGVLDTCLEGIAVSATSNPMGAYHVYFFNPQAANSDPGTGYLLPDFAKIGNTQDAFMLFYDEFNLNPATYPACPAFGCFSFNGAQQLAFSKDALERGLQVSSALFNVAYENMGSDPGLYPIPAEGSFLPGAASCFSGTFAGAVCWYQVIPAQTPDPSGYNNNGHGTGYMVASLDFLGAGDNRVAAFDWAGLSYLNSRGCGSCGGITFGGQLFTTQETYQDEGQSCPASSGGICGLAPQKAGPTPLGDNCALIGGAGLTSPCPESGIATNGDGTTQASYAQGQLRTSVSTLIVQTFQHGRGPVSSETHVGVAYWTMSAGSDGQDNGPSGASRLFSITSQGYVSASHEDLEFPSVAGTDSGSAVMAFTLSGDGGPTGADGGGFYPSTAYATLGQGWDWNGFGTSVIHIVDLGKSPQDGFSEYVGYPPVQGTRPRWGDYSQAIFVPSGHGNGFGASNGGHRGSGVFFGTEYIQSPNCSDSAFLADNTCGGTRAPLANWGSSINFISTS